MQEEVSLVRRTAPSPSPTLRDLMSVLFRQRRLVVISFVVIFGAVLLYGAFSSSYQAQMRVLLRRGRVDPAVTPTPTLSADFTRQSVTEEELNSEVELLRDEEILRKVAQAAGLVPDKPLWWEPGSDNERRQARAARELSRHLTVEPVRKTNLIAVSYRAADPVQGARVLRCLADAYLERHLQLRRPKGEFSFFEQQSQQARGSLEAAEQRLMEFTHDQGVVSAGLERDLELQKLIEAEAAERQNRLLLAETAQRARTLETSLQSLPGRMTTAVRILDNPTLQEKLKAKLLELQLKRTELLTKFEPGYRLVQEVDQQIVETQAALETENRVPLRDETTDLDPTHEWARGELLKAQVELSGLQAHTQAATRVLGADRKEIVRLGDRAIRQEMLLRDLKAAEEKYLLYIGKREEARIADALDQGGILNVTIAEAPQVPALPLRSRTSLVLLGLTVSCLGGMALAFASYALHPGFHTPDEIVAYLEVPVLACLPRKSGVQP